jgi:hypothetical protein
MGYYGKRPLWEEEGHCRNREELPWAGEGLPWETRAVAGGEGRLGGARGRKKVAPQPERRAISGRVEGPLDCERKSHIIILSYIISKIQH